MSEKTLLAALGRPRVASEEPTKPRGRDKRKRHPKRNGERGRVLLSPEMHAEIVRLLEEGNYRETVASAVGVAYSTLIGWIKDAEAQQEDSPFWELYCDVVKAEAEAECKLVRVARDATHEDGKFAIALLERRYPRRWGKIVRQEIGGEGGGPLRVDVRGVFEERLNKIAGRLKSG